MASPFPPETGKSDTPIRVGIYPSLADADAAVDGLLRAGFTQQEITVICSDEVRQAHFSQFEHQDPAGTFTPGTTIAGGAIGATLGGFMAIAGAVATGGLSLVAAGGIAAWAGGIVGSLIGAMMSRGVEKELADFYDQAVVNGKILVAVEDDSAGGPKRLVEASRILEQAGAEPMSMREG